MSKYLMMQVEEGKRVFIPKCIGYGQIGSGHNACNARNRSSRSTGQYLSVEM